MGFGIARLRVEVEVARRSRVSDMVLEVDWESRRTRDSMAATGMVRSGSQDRRWR